jgi:hypothetical protein
MMLNAEILSASQLPSLLSFGSLKSSVNTLVFPGDAVIFQSYEEE